MVILHFEEWSKAEMTKAWYQARLNSFAFNDPKKLPKSPEEMWKESGVKYLDDNTFVAEAMARKASLDQVGLLKDVLAKFAAAEENLET